MSIRVAINHTTTYDYERPIGISPQLVRLRPAPNNRTPIHSYSLRIEPKAHFLNWHQDPHGNYLARVVVLELTHSFQVKVDIVADLQAFNPFDFFLEPFAESFPFDYPPTLEQELKPYLETEPLTSEISAFLERLDKSKRRTVEFLIDTNRAVASLVKYVLRMEAGVQTPQQTLALQCGSCRDSSWLLIQVFRRLGIAARFVSGYLVQLKPDEPTLDGAHGPVEDFADLHAWCECYVPGAGWIGLDPTSGLLTAEGHIPLACTPQPSSAAPIEGATEKAQTSFRFHVEVRRIVDVPRVTKPYSDEQWHQLMQVGNQVDTMLGASNVQLTMGGELSFVSSEEPDAPEWNSLALGGSKRAVGERLLRRLHQRLKPGGLIQHGQGKWYPGEQLPRWAISCYYRQDGIPLWKDPALQAATGEPLGHTFDAAEAFAERLADNLGLTRTGLMTAFEDTWYYLWRERRLPSNVDPLDAKLEDPVERDRLARIFRQGLDTKVGCVLPLAHLDNRWVSERWCFRDERCHLVPGDSPMGYRLPLDSQRWLPAEEQNVGSPVPTGPAQGVNLKRRRTALCVQPREGILRVFLPPLSSTDGFVELVAAVECTAKDLGLPVQVEGFPPPPETRLGVFEVTPDRGVLEVSVPHVHSWPELVSQAEVLYESARHEHLASEKFELTGLHIGSGGNHQLIGSDTPLQSPFLRRPDVLGSLLRFWHNHPALSYLFSGRFIGPDSPAPRVDETRNDSVYELELALAQLPKPGQEVQPWLVDRLLRHLLANPAGNTQRAEFCIDQLYSPDAATGRLGLVELRSFEMPPHQRMANVQQLLLRSLIALFWNQPYTTPLVRWGTTLHDRFLLPYFVKRDLFDVVSYLEQRQLPIDPAWFEPHYQFRFPFYGQVEKDGIVLELRAALEPWRVLGEGAAGEGAPHVDSSLEKLQVKVKGMLLQRYCVCVNGVRLPLHPTGVQGESVCGVRYRAWPPPACLHPSFGVHGPLRFDIYDTWNERPVAGCTYHVVHPGGRADEARPVNAVAAESRRIARFEASGHTPEPYRAIELPPPAEYPLTLDLRRLITPGLHGH